MTARSPMLLGLMALIGTALSAMGSLPPTARAEADRPALHGEAKGPFRCALALSDVSDGTGIAARLTATEPVSGRYDLRLRAGGNAVDQGGDFDARAGETVTLSEATLPGSPESLDATLRVITEGHSVVCPREEG